MFLGAGAHQATTCERARVIATYSSRSDSPSSSVRARARWSLHCGPPDADVDAAVRPVVGVRVEPRDGRVLREAVPERRQVDDGVLQPLAAVDRDQLHRGRVAVEPAGPLAGDLDLVVGHLRAQPGQQGRRDRAARRWRPGAATARRAAGRSAAAPRRRGPAPGRSARLSRAASSTAATPRAAKQRRPSRAPCRATRSVRSSPAGVQLGGGAAEERRQGGAAHPARSGAAAPAPRAAAATRSPAGVPNTLPLPATTAGRRASASACCTVLQVVVAEGDDRDVARLQRLAVERRARTSAAA